MKRADWLLLSVLSLATFLFAQETEKAHQMTGTICNSKCVVQQSNLPTCDPSCTDKSGEAVFVDDHGKVMKVANQPMAMPHMGKHVKVMAVPTEKEREESLRILELNEQAP